VQVAVDKAAGQLSRVLGLSRRVKPPSWYSRTCRKPQTGMIFRPVADVPRSTRIGASRWQGRLSRAALRAVSTRRSPGCRVHRTTRHLRSQPSLPTRAAKVVATVAPITRALVRRDRGSFAAEAAR
jgi:hypothetical protein